MAELFEISDVSFGYNNATPVVERITLSATNGEFLGLIGPNGSGKSTLLQLLMGLLQPWSGKIHLSGHPVAQLRRKEIARRIALVPQNVAAGFSFSVREVVTMGRNPYIKRFGTESPRDYEIVSRAMHRTDTYRFADRPIDELSGGERQRVIVARAIAQETPLLLLDEPISNLDLAHQLDTLDLVRTLTKENHCAIAALHDLSLAARYCTRIVLLSQRTIAADGTPGEVITEANLAAHFDVKALVRHPGDVGPVVVPIAPLQQKKPETADSTEGHDNE